MNIDDISYCCFFVKGSHTSLSIKLRSRLCVLGCMQMCTASSAFLFHSCSLMFAPSQSILWSSSLPVQRFHCSYPLLTAALCSVILFWRLLPVSPIYTFSQSWHGISQTTPSSLRVLCDLKQIFTFSPLQSLWISSDRPLLVQLMKVNRPKCPEFIFP